MPPIQARNRILAALPPKDLKRISATLESTPLVYKETVCRSGDPIRHVYFPEQGVISLLSALGGKASLEVGIVGPEGLVGLPLYLGARVSGNTAVVQGSGSAFRMTAGDFLTECDASAQLPLQLRRFTNAFLKQVSQSAVCFRFHPADKRLARWLLMMSDRVGSLDFPVTQEFLSHMLGVRREAVNKCAGELQKRGLIAYSRGKLCITKRTRLERLSCECYSLIKKDEIGSGHIDQSPSGG
jgi:CRP-like cAMP-binding protein